MQLSNILFYNKKKKRKKKNIKQRNEYINKRKVLHKGSRYMITSIFIEMETLHKKQTTNTLTIYIHRPQVLVPT